jgi:hypothetical protein
METLQTNQLNLSNLEMRMIETALLTRSTQLWGLVIEGQKSMQSLAEKYHDLYKNVRAQLGRPEWSGDDPKWEDDDNE